LLPRQLDPHLMLLLLLLLLLLMEGWMGLLLALQQLAQILQG
jgi:hypothetical protein